MWRLKMCRRRRRRLGAGVLVAGVLAAAAGSLVAASASSATIFNGESSYERAGSSRGKLEGWCIPRHQHRRFRACGTIIPFSEANPTILTNDSPRLRLRHFRICSVSPADKRRCAARSTTVNRNAPLGQDTFRFATVFPHRLSGTYRISWYFHGRKLGSTLRLDYETNRNRAPA